MRFLLLFLTILNCICITALANEEWDSKTTGLIDEAVCQTELNAHTLQMPIDHDDPGVGDFKFRYFTDQPLDPNKPTAIFLDGGPGGIISPRRNPTLLLKDAVNIIYFHIRGAGCSQLPFSREFDKYLTVENVLADVESLRESLNLKRWDYVLGESFGAWLATKYSDILPERIDRIFIEGLYNPIWRNALGNDKLKDLSAQTMASMLEAMDNRKDISKGLAVDENSLKALYLKVIELATTYQLDLTRLAIYPEEGAQILAESKIQDAEGWKNVSPDFFLAIYLANYSGALDLSQTLTARQSAILTEITAWLKPSKVSATDLIKAHENLLNGFGSSSDPRYPTVSYRVVATLFPAIVKETQAGSLRNPTVIVAGSMDSATPLEGARARAEAMCNQNCLFIESIGGGHSLGSSVPLALYPKILARLNSGSLHDVAELFRGISWMKAKNL